MYVWNEEFPSFFTHQMFVMVPSGSAGSITSPSRRAAAFFPSASLFAEMVAPDANGKYATFVEMQFLPSCQFVYTTFVVTTSTSTSAFVLTTVAEANQSPPPGVIHVFVTTSARADAITAAASTAKKPNFLIFLLSCPYFRAIMIPNPSPLPQAEI